jgi:prepilin-type N-terminal cleavage/methylation domain-containing protein
VRSCGSEGFTLVEVLVAITLFSTAVLSLAHVGFATSRALREGRGVMASWTVAQGKLDSLAALGWAGLDGSTAGTDFVEGHPVSWTVAGGNPRRITLVVERRGPARVAADTFITFVADRP